MTKYDAKKAIPYVMLIGSNHRGKLETGNPGSSAWKKRQNNEEEKKKDTMIIIPLKGHYQHSAVPPQLSTNHFSQE